MRHAQASGGLSAIAELLVTQLTIEAVQLIAAKDLLSKWPQPVVFGVGGEDPAHSHAVPNNRQIYLFD